MSDLQITSREYKLMLQTTKFGVTDDGLSKRAQAFWTTYKKALREVGVDAKKDLDELDQEKKRAITFYDTEDFLLNDRGRLFHDFVFRKRVNEETNDVEVTLKYRHPDRYIAQSRVRQDRRSGDNINKYPLLEERKFEEDIKPVGKQKQMRSLYSLSRTLELKEDKEFERLGQIVELFPDLATHLKVDPNRPVQAVRGFTATERVVGGGRLKLGTDDKAKCAIVAWYDLATSAAQPVVVEFSFKDKEDDALFETGDATDAYVAFVCATGLAEWLDPEPLTKTAYAYQRA